MNQSEINWIEAPDWANYHAFDSCGMGYWYKEKPVLDNENYQWKSQKDYAHSFYIQEIAGWKESLSQRSDNKQSQ